MKLKKVLLLIGICIGFHLSAISDSLTTYSIIKWKGQWLLQVDYSTKVFNRTMKDFGVEVSLRHNRLDYEKEASAYLLEHLDLYADDVALQVESLRGKDTVFTRTGRAFYRIQNLPSDWQELAIKADSFSSTEGHKNLLSIRMPKEDSRRVFLTKENSYQAVLKRREDQ